MLQKESAHVHGQVCPHGKQQQFDCVDLYFTILHDREHCQIAN